jgi:hypothetical protein
MRELLMTEKQKKVIQRLFVMGKTYHSIVDDAGIKERPDKFEDLSYDVAKEIIRIHNGLLGLNR